MTGSAAVLADALLAWYRNRVRDLPWRGERDPYRIWVAEVMAQQTRVQVVKRYWPAFVERFPDVASLAAAELDDVLLVWEGLGYYGRARNLHRAARIVERRHGGELPSDPDELIALPGIGPYTAGALASIAFGHPVPAVDTNSRRVVTRLFDLRDPRAADLEAAAQALLESDPAAAGELNQALMDLGAAVCTSSRPRCDACPVSHGCRALAAGTVTEWPGPRSRRTLPHQKVAVGLLRRGGRVFIQRRPPTGFLGGLWEFPGGKIRPQETPEQALVRELREELEVDATPGDRLPPIEHAYSHLRVTLHAFRVERFSGEPQPKCATAWLWAAPEELGEYAFPTANRRLIALLERG